MICAGSWHQTHGPMRGDADEPWLCRLLRKLSRVQILTNSPAIGGNNPLLCWDFNEHEKYVGHHNA